MNEKIKTADLCDENPAITALAATDWRTFGAKLSFGGAMTTVKCFEDNSLVRAVLETPGLNRVLVVDGGGSTRCALLGGALAELGRRNQWTGLVINGCIRDSEAIAEIDIGVRALASCPMKSLKRGLGEIGRPVRFAGVEFTPGRYLYADADGMIVSNRALP